MNKYRIVIRDGVYRILRPKSLFPAAFKFHLSNLPVAMSVVRGMINSANAEREAIARMRINT